VKKLNQKPDNSSLFGCMKGEIKINGDIFSTGAWPSDEEMIRNYDEMVSDTEAEAEAESFALIEGAIGDVGDEPWAE